MNKQYYELDNSYASGFEDSKHKALNILRRYINGPYKEDKKDLIRKIYTKIKEM
jgi:hypothetical protein